MEQHEKGFFARQPGMGTSHVEWSPNVIIADAAYIDRVAFNLIVNFERMLMRRIPPADLARWIDCVALDGGLRPMENTSSEAGSGEQVTQVVLIHPKGQEKLENFQPAHFADELTGKAFRDHLGEFVITSLAVESMVDEDALFLDVLGTVCQQKEVRRVMVIPDAEKDGMYAHVRETLSHLDDDSKRVTVFAMQPMTGGNFRQEILGYSLMNALGIQAEEIK